ncbi:MAG: nucleotide-binding protein [Lachnospiraceae bacterium]|nr:nucleotide-binding protein [Lachnospiraceae bacterium]
MEINVRCCKTNTRINQIIKAINIINGVQSYFYIKLESDLDVDVCEEEYVNWELFCKNYSLKDNEYVIYITEKPFDDNWFSHEESQFAIITMNSWEEVFAPPSLKAYLVYQIAQTLISFEGDLNEKMEMRMVHDFAEGCMFDLCVNKKDIKLGMIAGNICPQCRAVLVRYGINEKALNAVERMLWFVRSEAIGKPIIFDEDAAFIVMRFSTNDENDNAFKYGVKSALEELNIKCVRADNIISSGQLLEKIKRNIEKSRFIIAKVDSDNLNVYFELGLAMGLDKDVLLVSEKELVLQLPSDLKNWECLTYSKGNYEELKANIIKYFQDNYHYR